VRDWLRLGSPAERTTEVECRVEIEESHTALHAHVELEGFWVEPGDSVLVHEAPTGVRYGENLSCQRRATVTRASTWKRAFTRMTGLLELGELFELGFSSRRIR
jgi:hypothetical protein